jgi:hypothetical protein
MGHFESPNRLRTEICSQFWIWAGSGTAKMIANKKPFETIAQVVSLIISI